MILALTCMNVPTLWGGYYHYLYVPDEETKAQIIGTYPHAHLAGTWLSGDL